ncbi:benzoylformate decarboxylase [Diplocarpon rosae]|nr:benzoylformate decarboxylase [Diplocarpon rosae]
MPPTTIHEPPAADSFTSLEQHQTQTPSTFYNAKPVLHYTKSGIRVVAALNRLSGLPILGPGANGESQSTTAGLTEALDGNQTVQLVDIWISSENLTLFNQATQRGMSIPYPAISLHAIQRIDDPAEASYEVPALYMQLDLSDHNGVSDEEFEDPVELSLIPGTSSGETEGDTIKKLFEAVSHCSNLHPDPTVEGDEDEDEDDRIIFEGSVGYEGISGLPGVQAGAGDGGLPPPFPGSGGWITAENVGDYFDEDGNWIRDGETSLGEGAGRTRTRGEMNEAELNGNGNHDTDESKRPRTE